MKRSLSLLLIALFLISCGGGDDPADPDDGGNNNTTPKPTAVGTADGTATTQSIGPGGGTVTSSDGALTLTIPPGALASKARGLAAGGETEITIQPITNTAWGGRGQAFRLLPDGLTFATPVEITFSLDDTVLTGSDTSFVDIARQQDDGTWGVMKSRRIDWESRTITTRTSHFSDYSMIEGVQLRPASATVGVGQNLRLYVRVCDRTGVATSDPDLVDVVIQCDDGDDALVPVGTFTNWSVNGVGGGNSMWGRVAPTSGPSAVYTAPSALPGGGNPVAVSLRTNYQGSTALLVSNVTITSASYTGVIYWRGADNGYDTPDSTHIDLTWTSDGSAGDVETLTGAGTVTYTLLDQVDCPSETLTPNSAPLNPNSTYMIINRTVDPPSIGIAVSADWDAQECYQCLTDPEYCVDSHWVISFSDNTSVLSEDGNTITGQYLDLDTGEYWYFTFTRPATP